MSNTDETIGYAPDTIRDKSYGFSYDIEKLDNLGSVDRKGVRLLYDRRQNRLEVTRSNEGFRKEDLIEDIRGLVDGYKDEMILAADREVQSKNQVLMDVIDDIEAIVDRYDT